MVSTLVLDEMARNIIQDCLDAGADWTKEHTEEQIDYWRRQLARECVDFGDDYVLKNYARYHN